MIIIKKVKIVPAPVTPFVGTTLTIRTTRADAEFGIYNISPAEGHAEFSVHWGDGGTDRFSEVRNQPLHTYATAGVHTIRISDDAASLTVIGSIKPDVAFSRFAALPIAFSTNATMLDALGAYYLGGCPNLTTLDLVCSHVTQTAEGPFKDCTALAGEVYLPCLRQFSRSSSVFPFAGCTGLTKIHFAAANEAAVKSTTAYQADSTLGTGTAAVVFDL